MGIPVPELRQNFFTEKWVIIATERAQRPEELARHRPAQEVPALVETCPFCPGNETKTPPEVMCHPTDGGPWPVRVIPKQTCRPCERRATSSQPPAPAAARQRVRLPRGNRRQPDHSRCMAMLSDEQVATIFGIYKQRFNVLSLDPHISHHHDLQESWSGRGSELAASALAIDRDASDPQPGAALEASGYCQTPSGAKTPMHSFRLVSKKPVVRRLSKDANAKCRVIARR